MKKITLFDKIIITLTILAIAFFGYIFFRKSTYVTTTIKVNESSLLWTGPNTRTWFASMFYPGMKEQDGIGRSMAEVTSIYAYDTSPEKKAVYLTLKLNSVYNRASNQYTFKGTPLLIGSTIKLNLDQTLVEGLVTQVEGAPDPRTPVKLRLFCQIIHDNPTFPETSGERQFIADSLHLNQQVTDSNNNPIITITEKDVTPATKTVVTSNGQVFSQTDPLLKDIFLTLEVNAHEVAGQYFLFDDIPITVGRSIPINLPHISIAPSVTRIELIE